MGAWGKTEIEPKPESPQPSPGRPGKYFRKVRSFSYGNWMVRLVAAATFLNGLLNILLILSIRFPQNPHLLSRYTPFGLYYFNQSLNLVLGFMLIFVSFNLFQRRKIAWWLASIGSGMAIFTRAIDSELWPSAVIPIFTLVLLIYFRHRFTVRSGWHSIERGLILTSGTIILAFGYGIIGFLLLDRSDFGVAFNFLEALSRTAREFSLMGNNDLIPQTRYASWFLESLRITGIISAVVILYSIFRPVAYQLTLLPYDTARARYILERYAHSSYDYFKVWRDKSYFFSETRESFISYRVELNVAVCLGDAVGPPAEQESITQRFKRYCHDNGWGLTFMLPDSLDLYRRLGLHILKIGEEGIVDLEHFSTVTSQNKYFRHIRRRFEGEGYQLIRYLPPHLESLIDEIEVISRRWLTLPGYREFGFAQGTFERNYVRQTPLSVLRDSTHQAIAFVNESPSYRSGEAGFDMMRHLPEVPHGTMDYIFLNLMLILKREGYKTLAMGVAPFAGVGEDPRSSLPARAMHQLFNYNWFAHSKGLRLFKIKFEPYWEDRFIAYQGGPLALVKIGLAITRAVERVRPASRV